MQVLLITFLYTTEFAIMNVNNTSSISSSTGTIRSLYTRHIAQAGSTLSSNIDKLAIKLYDILKEKYVNHGNRVKDFSNLTYNDIISNNVNYILICYYY